MALTARGTYFYHQHQQGRTYQALAQAFGLSPTRVREVARQHASLDHPPRLWLDDVMDPCWRDALPNPMELSMRAYNCLMNFSVSFSNIRALHAALQGPYRPSSRMRGCGKITRQELLTWLEPYMPAGGW